MGQVLLPGASGQWLASLTDAGISSDLQASLADGVLTFAEASKLVQDVIARGPLTASELSGLQSIVANLNLSFSADNYTANALTHFVSAGAANATWNGGTATATSLGDLQAGMSGALLSQLYGKWFTGADMPDPTMVAVAGTRGTVYPVHYTSLGYPLFGSNGPVAEDVNQGFEGTCVVLSAMLLMIKNHPDQLRSMFHDNGDGSWGVRFYINGSEYWETVNAQLPERDPGILVYANQGTSTSPSIWAELIEKAYAQLSATGLIGHTASVDSYANINTNQMYTVLKAFTGASATRYYYASDSNWYDDKQLIIAALANGDDVMMATGPATTDSSVDAAGNTLLVGDHAYAVERYDAATGNFVVRNPFGQQASGQYWLTEFEVSMADIVKVHGEVCIDNTARTPVRVSEIQSISNGASWPWAHITAGTANRIGGLFSVTDTNGKDITQYALEAIGTDQINLNGATNLATAAQQAQNTVVVSASDLSKLTFAAAATTGQTTLMIAASDGTDWSPMSRLILDIQASRVLTSPAVHAAVAGQTVPITKLVAYDSSVNMSSDRFSFIATPGLIQLNGATNLWVNPPTGGIYVSATDLQKLTVAVPASGVIDIQAHAYSGGAWSAWTEVVVQAAQPVAQSIQNYDNGQTTGSHAVGDTAANIFASIDGLQQMMISGAVDTVLVTDKPSSAIALSEKQWQSDMGVLSVTSGTFSLALNGLTATEAATMPSVASSHVASVTVTDSLANVATRLDALHTLAAAGKLAQVSVSGGFLTLTESQLQSDADAVGKITGATRVSAAMTAAHTQYTITQGASGLTISGNGHTESLAHVDRLQFSDGYVAFDISGDAGQAYRLYQAAFNRTPDTSGLGYQTNALDSGLSLAQVAANFIASPEFQSKYGSVDNTQFLTLLYQNVLHRAPDSGGLQYHLNELAAGQSRADELTHFSESPENQANVIGQIQNGMFFTLS